MAQPEGWINRIESDRPRIVNILPQQGKEPSITYFEKKRIYLPSEQQEYESNVLNRQQNTLWLGITGWTKPPKHYSERYGSSEEAKLYERLVGAILAESILTLKKEGISVDVRHGASDAGVDAAIINLIEKMGLSGSGVSCPIYMPWVKDDARGGPIFVAESKEKYHEAYSKYTNILLVTGGRDVAFYHDYINRLRGDGASIVVDVMQTVSSEVIPGKDKVMPSDPLQLNNAAAYIREKNSFTYTPVVRSFDELSFITQLTVLHNAYKILGLPENFSVLQGLEHAAINSKNDSRKVPTKADLDKRIDSAISEYSRIK